MRMGAHAAGMGMLTENPQPSSRWRFALPALVAVSLLTLTASATAVNLSRAETQRIGKRIWQNECNGTVAGLTSWNAGENFASLGIGHFIWYPEGMRGPFEESFPKLVDFISSRGGRLPEMLLAGRPRSCPWRSRAEFQAAANSAQMKQLRAFLADTVDMQAEFLVQRLEQALPKMIAEGGGDAARIRRQFERVAATGDGCYALVDYVNFKGEGVLRTERYNGRGWGLLQVLEGMKDNAAGNGSAVREFAASARAVLTERVHNAPPDRHEDRWLPGWLNRIGTYTRG